VIGAAVEAFAKAFAGFEEGQTLGIHFHRFARAGVAACAGFAGFYRESAEAAKFDPVAARQCRRDFIEDGVDDFFDVAQEQMGVAFRQFLDELGFGHGQYLLKWPPLALVSKPWRLYAFHWILFKNDPKTPKRSSKTLIDKDILSKWQKFKDSSQKKHGLGRFNLKKAIKKPGRLGRPG